MRCAPVVGVVVAAFVAGVGGSLVPYHSAKALQSPQGYDAAAWNNDYAALKRELERNYSHLAWFGSPQSGVNLPQLDSMTRRALREATTDMQAADAIRRFVAGFRDGHFAPAAVSPRPAAAVETRAEPSVVNTATTASGACAAFGYAPVTRVAFSMPFESLPGFELLTDGLRESFRSGVLRVDNTRIGIVRIPRFRAIEYVSVCERAWHALAARGTTPTRDLVAAMTDDEWLRTLARRLIALRRAGATIVLVDVGGNGGGNDLGDWAVRLFTREPVHSAPLLMSASPVAVPLFDEEIGDLTAAAAALPASRTISHERITRALDGVTRRKAAVHSASCDMTWVWNEQRTWNTSSCNRLIDAGFFSGPLSFLERRVVDTTAARALYWASRADPYRGAWSGPVYVLTNQATGSAAEGFTALMKDRGIATTIGTRTAGDGCGFMDASAPFVLTHSQLAFAIPNCVRLRADSSDEVAGVTPDVEIRAADGESARATAWRAIAAIVTAHSNRPASARVKR